MALFSKQRLGIDLGTANTLIYIENKGVALREPSIVAINKETKEPIAFGKEAERLVGRTSDNIEIVRPMRDGVIANFSLTKQMLGYFIKKAVYRSFKGPDVVICVPSNITKVEKRAVIDAIKDLGINKALIVDEAYAAAVGANLALHEPKGKMVVDVGGGTTDMAVISFGEMVRSKAIVYGGHKMNEIIADYVRENYKLIIEINKAEEIKIAIGNAAFTKSDEQDSFKVKGRNVATGLPDEKEVSGRLVAEALDEIIIPIITAIKQVLEDTPPELAVDILETGIILTGGGALLKRLPERIYKEIGIPVHLANTPLDTVVMGAGKLLKEMESQARLVERARR